MICERIIGRHFELVLLVSVVVGLVASVVVVVELVEAAIIVVTGRSFALQLQIGRQSLRQFIHRFVIVGVGLVLGCHTRLVVAVRCQKQRWWMLVKSGGLTLASRCDSGGNRRGDGHWRHVACRRGGCCGRLTLTIMLLLLLMLKLSLMIIETIDVVVYI